MSIRAVWRWRGRQTCTHKHIRAPPMAMEVTRRGRGHGSHRTPEAPSPRELQYSLATPYSLLKHTLPTAPTYLELFSIDGLATKAIAEREVSALSHELHAQLHKMPSQDAHSVKHTAW